MLIGDTIDAGLLPNCNLIFVYFAFIGIQAELVLGIIAKKENKNSNSDRDYFEDRVSFSEDKLMDSDSKAVMMASEKPLMEAHAKAVCSGGFLSSSENTALMTAIMPQTVIPCWDFFYTLAIECYQYFR